MPTRRARAASAPKRARKPAKPAKARARAVRGSAGKRRTRAGTPDTSKYSAAVHRTIVKARREGLHKSIAFRLAGIHEDTGFQWLKLARERPDEYPRYAKLELDMTKAHAQWIQEMQLIVNNTARKREPASWLPAMTALERAEPSLYGRRDTTVIEGGESPIQVLSNAVFLDPETRKLSLDLFERVASLRPDVAGGARVGDESAANGGKGRR